MIKLSVCFFILNYFLIIFCKGQQNQSYSNYIGFQVERIRANSLTLIGLNTPRIPNTPDTRKISELFGLYNSSNLTANANYQEADIIWVQKGGQWIQVFYSDRDLEFPPITQGWRAVGWGDTDMSGLVIEKGFFIESKQNVDWGLAIGGYVNITDQVHVGLKSFSIVNRGTPIPITFAEANIQNSKGFKKGNQSEADLIWIQNEGVWEAYYYALDSEFPPLTEGWKKIGSGNEDYNYQLITSSAFLLDTQGSDKVIRIQSPSNFHKIPKETDPLAPTKADIQPRFQLGFGQLANRLYFVGSWNGKIGIRYTTEIYDPAGWWTLSVTDGNNNVLNNSATIGSELTWGVARVISEYIN